MSDTPPPIPAQTSLLPAPVLGHPPTGTDTKDLLRFEAEKKSAGLAFVLCWLFGIWGAHRFYLGRAHGATMLIITLISIPFCLIIIGFFGVFAMWVWMIVDLFSVSRWVKEYNTTLLVRITSGQG